MTDGARHIVLVGGGHAHVHVLRAFGLRPRQRVTVTLISREGRTPYSGMVPGVVAGHYDEAAAHIDLRAATSTFGARFVQGEVVGLDRSRRQVMLESGASVSYDLLSIDVGITPMLAALPGAAEHATAVKPISSFLDRFAALRTALKQDRGPRAIAVIGGGAAGVEIVLALQFRLARDQAGGPPPSFVLIDRAAILRAHPPRVRDIFLRICAKRRISIVENAAVAGVGRDGLVLDDGRRIAADTVLVTTGAAAPPWLRATGLAVDEEGFLATQPTLQVANDDAIFAAGDCAAIIGAPRPKAGVFAVRAGPPLADNLWRRLTGQPLRRFVPQREHLVLISAGERYAVGARNGLVVEGRWVWRWKDWIDRRFMRRYRV